MLRSIDAIYINITALSCSLDGIYSLLMMYPKRQRRYFQNALASRTASLKIVISGWEQGLLLDRPRFRLTR